MGVHLILFCLSPELFHVGRRTAVIFGKICKDHFIVLFFLKQFKADIRQEIIILIIIFADRLAAKRQHLAFVIFFQSGFLHDFQRQFHILVFLPVQAQAVQIFPAYIHIPQFIKQTLALIWDGIRVMTSILSLPYKPRSLGI